MNLGGRVLALVAGLGGLCAADLEERAWQLGIERLPGTLDYTVSAPNGTFPGSVSTESEALVLGWRRTFAGPGWSQGPMLLGEGAVIHGTFGGGDLSAVEGRAGLGWAYAINRRWTVWAAGHVAASLGRLSVSDVSFGSKGFSGHGWAWTTGLGASWAWNDSWSLTARAGWRNERWNFSGDGLNIRIDGAGPLIGIGLEWHPSAQPRGLE